jgi:hypothetical protein
VFVIEEPGDGLGAAEPLLDPDGPQLGYVVWVNEETKPTDHLVYIVGLRALTVPARAAASSASRFVIAYL